MQLDAHTLVTLNHHHSCLRNQPTLETSPEQYRLRFEVGACPIVRPRQDRIKHLLRWA